MNTVVERPIGTAQPKQKCLYQAISPKGGVHCVHDDATHDWRIAGGCTPSLCPISNKALSDLL